MSVPQIQLHANGPLVSRIVFGAWRLNTWELSTAQLLELLHTCVELGITTIDHADIYGSYTCEALFGAALREEPGLRERIQLISKCGIKLVSPQRPEHGMKMYDTSCAHILSSVENSLRALGTDYLDLLLLHRPDPFMDVDETAAALMELHSSGKVLFVGVSNFTPSQYDLLASRLSIPLVTNQIEMSVLKLNAFQDGSLDQCQRLKIAPMAWSPMGGGSLFTGTTPQVQRVREALVEVGAEIGATSVDQVALAWLLCHPAGIVPILGTGKAERVKAAAGAVELKMTREHWFKIWVASMGAGVA